MTRADFVKLAAMIAAIPEPEERRRTALYNAKFLPQLNPRFDREKFLEACGVTDP